MRPRMTMPTRRSNHRRATVEAGGLRWAPPHLAVPYPAYGLRGVGPPRHQRREHEGHRPGSTGRQAQPLPALWIRENATVCALPHQATPGFAVAQAVADGSLHDRYRDPGRSVPSTSHGGRGSQMRRQERQALSSNCSSTHRFERRTARSSIDRNCVTREKRSEPIWSASSISYPQTCPISRDRHHATTDQTERR